MRDRISQFSLSVMSNSLWPHGLQHARPPWPSPTPRACSNSRPSSWWCHPTISSSIVPFSSCPQSFPASGTFTMSQFFTSGGQSIGASASASVLPMRNRMDRCKCSQCGNQHWSAWWGWGGSLHCLEPKQLVIPFGHIWCFCFTSHIPMSMRPSPGSGIAGKRTAWCLPIIRVQPSSICGGHIGCPSQLVCGVETGALASLAPACLSTVAHTCQPRRHHASVSSSVFSLAFPCVFPQPEMLTLTLVLAAFSHLAGSWLIST